MRDVDRERAAAALHDFSEAYLNVDALMGELVKAGPKPSQTHVIALSTNFALLQLALGDLIAAAGDMPPPEGTA